MWQAATGNSMRVKQHHAMLRFAAFSPDGKRVLTLAAPGLKEAGANGPALAYLWDASSGEDVIEPWPVEHLTRDAEAGAEPMPAPARWRWRRAAAFGADGKRIATIENWAVALLDPEQPNGQRWSWFETPGVKAVAFSSDGTLLVTAGPEVCVWDIATRRRLSLLEWTRQTQDAAFTADGRQVLLAGHSWEGRWRNWRPPVHEFRVDGDGTGIWDSGTGKQLFGVRALPAHPRANAPTVACSPDGKQIAVGQTGQRQTTIYQLEPRNRK